MGIRPPKLAFDLEYDLRVLSEMVSNLTPYLYENEVYGYLSGNLPRLTLGGILMRLYRLTHLKEHLNPAQRNTLEKAQNTFKTQTEQWATHYATKLQNEIQARLNTLEQFITECNHDAHACAAGYPTQAEKRTMIEHLQAEAASRGVLTDQVRSRINHLDNRLRRILLEGPLITDERLKAVYPVDRFWWMYGYIAEDRN